LHCTSGFIYQWRSKAPGFVLRTRPLELSTPLRILRQICNPHGIATTLETIATSLLVVDALGLKTPDFGPYNRVRVVDNVQAIGTDLQRDCDGPSAQRLYQMRTDLG